MSGSRMKEVMKRISNTRCILLETWIALSAAKFSTTAAPMKKTTTLEISLSSVKFNPGTARFKTTAVQIDTKTVGSTWAPRSSERAPCRSASGA